MVISNTVKKFKNSQQINYKTHHGMFYADRERNNPSFLNSSKMLNVSTFGNTADIYAIVHLVPHACQHITVDQSHSSGDTVVKMCRLAGSGGTKTVSFTNPKKQNWHGVNSGDLCGHRFNASSSLPVPPLWPVPIGIPPQIFVVRRRAALSKDVIITVFIQL